MGIATSFGLKHATGPLLLQNIAGRDGPMGIATSFGSRPVMSLEPCWPRWSCRGCLPGALRKAGHRALLRVPWHAIEEAGVLPHLAALASPALPAISAAVNHA